MTRAGKGGAASSAARQPEMNALRRKKVSLRANIPERPCERGELTSGAVGCGDVINVFLQASKEIPAQGREDKEGVWEDNRV